MGKEHSKDAINNMEKVLEFKAQINQGTKKILELISTYPIEHKNKLLLHQEIQDINYCLGCIATLCKPDISRVVYGLAYFLDVQMKYFEQSHYSKEMGRILTDELTFINSLPFRTDNPRPWKALLGFNHPLAGGVNAQLGQG